jgi:glycosyltransferase involved in cell wall biosynthesis
MTPDLPLVSIITPVYNGAKYLDDLIRSVQTQDYPNIEHIIIDDGSQDDGATVAVLRKYPHLRWWSRENRGQYATMNEGLDAAQGDYVCFISADDLIMPGAIQSVIQTFNNHPGYNGVSGLTHFITADGLPYPIKFPFQTAPLKYYAYYSHVAHCSLYVFREWLLKEKLLFDPSLKYVGDYDWLLRVIAKSRIYQANIFLSKVRIHSEQTSARYKQAMEEEHRRVIASHPINPLCYIFFTTIYIVLNDIEKMRFAWNKKGCVGVYQLFIDHVFRKNRTRA